MSAAPINVRDVIDSRPVGRLQIGLFILCGLIAGLDGFDIQSIGYTASAIAPDLHISKAALGAVFSAGILGSTLGATFVSPLADIFGRRRLLILSALTFAVFTLAAPSARNVQMLSVIRFFAGAGTGAALPVLIALCAEYAPKRVHATVVTFVFAGVPAGGLLGGLASAYLIPHLGWRSVFYLGGAIPLVLAAIAIWRLPESLRFLISRDERSDRARTLLARLSGRPVGADERLIGEPHMASKASWAALFADGQGLDTFLLWASFFMALTILNVQVTWAPVLLHLSGMTISAAALVIAGNNLGSLIGHLVTGRLIDRLGAHGVVAANFVGAAICFVAVAASPVAVGKAVGMLAAGYCMGSVSAGLTVLAAVLYPTRVRATGIGAATGIGRVGGVLSPLIASALLGAGWRPPLLFAAAALPLGLGAVTVILLAMRPGARSHEAVEPDLLDAI